MIPRPFEYHVPRSLPEAIALLNEHGEGAKLLAGGHSLLPMMKLRFAEPEHLIDLGKLTELKGIREVDGEIRIGAMTTENELIWSELLQTRCPLLVEGARQISDPQVRYRGTLGGDISHGDPGNDHPALMIALDAAFVLLSEQRRTGRAGGRFLCRYLYDAAGTRRNHDGDPYPDAGGGHRLLLRQTEAQNRRLRDRGDGGDVKDERRHGRAMCALR